MLSFPAALMVGGLVLAGCATAPYDPATYAALQKVQSDSGQLFPQLIQPAPACLYSSNASKFDQVSADLSSLQQRVNGISNNKLTISGVSVLGNGFTKFRSAEEAGASDCLPSVNVQDYQSTFDGSVTNLMTAEQQKPKGN
jgi:hypothetical protein